MKILTSIYIPFIVSSPVLIIDLQFEDISGYLIILNYKNSKSLWLLVIEPTGFNCSYI